MSEADGIAERIRDAFADAPYGMVGLASTRIGPPYADALLAQYDNLPTIPGCD